MPAAKQDDRIPIASPIDLAAQFESIEYALAQKETEDSWQRLEKALVKLEAVTKGGGYKFDEFIGHMKAIAAPLTRSLLSERTRLSGAAADVIQSIAPRLAERFDPLVNLYIPPLVQICARTNKVAFKRAEKCLHLIAKHCKLPSTLPLLREACKDKFTGLRVVAVNTTTLLLEYAGRERLGRKVGDIETIISLTATDPHPEVRQNSKRLFENYVDTWPDRVEAFTTNFTPTIRRYLSLPKTGAYKPDPQVFAARRQASPVLPKQPSSDPPSPRAPQPPKRLHPTQGHGQSVTMKGTSSKSGGAQAGSSQDNNFLERLAAAKNRTAKTPSHIQSTGMLRGLNSADVFGQASTGVPQVAARERAAEHREKDGNAGSWGAQSVKDHQSEGQRAEQTSSAIVAVGLQPPPRRIVAESEARDASNAPRRAELSKSLSSSHAGVAGEGTADMRESDARQTKTVPSTPRTGATLSSGASSPSTGAEQDVVNSSDVEGCRNDAAPSDGVARRLASLAQEHRAPERGSMRSTEDIATGPHAGRSDAPRSVGPSMPSILHRVPSSGATKASRVAVPVANVRPVPPPRAQAAQRQPTASRAPAPATAPSNDVEKAKNLVTPSSSTSSQKPEQPQSRPVAKPKSDRKAIAKPPGPSPKKVGPLKGNGKVVSSTTQSLSAKSKAVTSSAAARRAAAALNAQAAREAVVAKKQAEVAQLRAQAKLRSERAALNAAESQATVQARTQQLRHATQTHSTATGGAAKLPKALDGGDRVADRPQRGKHQGPPGPEVPSRSVALDERGEGPEEPVPNEASPEGDSGPAEDALTPHQDREFPRDHLELDVKAPTAANDEEAGRTTPDHGSLEVYTDQQEHEASVVPLSHLTPFRRCRRPNGALDSPADKIRAQLALSALKPKSRDDSEITASKAILSPTVPLKTSFSSPIRTGRNPREEVDKENAMPFRQQTGDGSLMEA